MDKESVVLGCGCEVFGDEAEELKQRFRLLRLLIVSTALYAAWLCAMSSGSTAKGALLMLAFALGTVPLMLLFASLGCAAAARLDKISAQARRGAGHVHGAENADLRSLAFALRFAILFPKARDPYAFDRR